MPNDRLGNPLHQGDTVTLEFQVKSIHPGAPGDVILEAITGPGRYSPEVLCAGQQLTLARKATTTTQEAMQTART